MGITVETVAGPDRSGTSVALATKELADYGFLPQPSAATERLA
ncbi:MAG: hypothetical protein ACRDYB_11455 [Acidimicrobiales bacterium]